MENLSIGTDYPRQQARLRRLLKEYQSIPEGVFGAMTIEAALAQAEQAMASGDVVRTMVAYSAMTEIE
jgi:hypothetical protein